ncbi:MAG: YtxH domain-containing protein [bacterium]
MAEREGGSPILAFLVGLAVGAGLALLFAPRSGRETQERIKESIEDLRSEMEKLLKQGREFFEAKREELLEAVESGREALKKET